jgi:galactokinase
LEMAAQIEDVVVRTFKSRFGDHPRVFAAPGRINIIGEHTDYSEGLVMPAAIDRRCVVAMGSNGGDSIRVLTLSRQEEVEIPTSFTPTGTWVDYVSGVRQSLRDAGIEVPGCDLVIHSDVPEGAGVSSSAALEVATMLAMLASAGVTTSPVNVALWAQSAEVKYVGVPCGVMDQFISANGVAGHALLLDCRSLEYERARLPENVAFLVVDSTVRHRLVDGGYAARRADCEKAAELLGVRVLRDAQLAALDTDLLPERVMRRARHVISENERVRATAAALSGGNISEVGRLMIASHSSLRDDFDVTCTETDTLARIANQTNGVHGARQMGGGFGGAVLALVDATSVQEAAHAIKSAYRAQTGLSAAPFVCRIAGRASEITS